MIKVMVLLPAWLETPGYAGLDISPRQCQVTVEVCITAQVLRS
jgi:hypothetical protein